MAVQVGPAQTETLVTGEDLLAMGDIGPSELVEGREVREFGEADTLTGDDVLPGFSMPVAHLFEE